DPLSVLAAQLCPPHRIAKQPRERRRKGRTVVARHDEVAVFATYNGFHIADIYRGDRTARRHCFQQGYRHLFRIGGQGEYVEAAENRLRSHLTGKIDAADNPKLAGETFQRAAFASITGNHET